MTEPTTNHPVEQLLQHTESLRAAGIVWLPREATLDLSTVTAAETEPDVPASGRSLPELPQVQSSIGAPPVHVGTPEERLAALDVLRGQVAECTRCPALVRSRRQTVFGVGPLDPDLCFLGEAPGADEDAQGEPFVGAAGQLLNRIIVACGMRREDVFICNILRCRPPGNRTPTAEESENCRPFLEQTLDLVRPRVICALGATAVQNLLGISGGITRLRGRWLEYRGIPVMPTFHPAYLLRSPAGKKDVWEDMKTILNRLGRQIPGRTSGD